MQVAQDQTSLLFIKNNQSGFFSTQDCCFVSLINGVIIESTHEPPWITHSSTSVRPPPRPLARPVPAERGEIPEHTIDEKQTLFMGKV